MKTTKRIKASSLKSRAEFDAAVDQLARTTVELRSLEAKRDAALQTVRDLHDGPLAERASLIDGLALSVEKFAEEHRDELFTGKVKSAETALAHFGFRLGQPTLKTLGKAWSWERVLETLDELKLSRFIRTKRECDKEAMKAHLDTAQLATVGCRIDQAETFFVEPKEQPSAERSAA